MRSKTARSFGLCGALLALAAGVGAQQAPPTVPATTAAPAAAPASASLTLGGSVILTLRSSAGGMTPQQRVDSIDARLSELLGTPDIKPADVTVYTPAGKAPVIYALGRKLITVDTVTAKGESGNKTPLQVAETWAKRLQQVLPRVNWRPSNEAEPVIPANPPLTVTSDLAKVGGNVGLVTLRNKVVLKVLGPQSGGMTAQERADMLSRRLQVAANRLQAPTPDDISVVPVAPTTVKAPAPAVVPVAAVKGAPDGKGDKAAVPAVDNQAQIVVGTTPIITLDDVQAQAAGYKSAALLANAWAKNVRTALGLSAVVAPPAATPPPATDASSAPPAPNSPTPTPGTPPAVPTPAAAPSKPAPGG